MQASGPYYCGQDTQFLWDRSIAAGQPSPYFTTFGYPATECVVGSSFGIVEMTPQIFGMQFDAQPNCLRERLPSAVVLHACDLATSSLMSSASEKALITRKASAVDSVCDDMTSQLSP